MRLRVLFLAAVLAGCTTIRPSVGPESLALPPPASFHRDLDLVLARFVNDLGQVDYAGLERRPDDLERYYALLTRYSPDSHPRLFPTRAAELAYWINAYNASVLKTVLAHYPIESVADVRPPPILSLLTPHKSGFFFFQRVTFGGKTTSLYYLEHGVIRRRFADPRVHFALNCAARGCPRLPREAFHPDRLDEQLDRAARSFLSEQRNLRIDRAGRAVYLSSIFDWYGGDFLAWLEKQGGGTLLDYVARYAPAAQANELAEAGPWELRFLPYDWRLNDQAASE